MTPIFIRSWLMKMTRHLDLEIEPVSFRRDCDIRRACRPTWLSPISPSISARGTKAATESMTRMSTAVERDSDVRDADGVGAGERVGDLERLLAGIGLRDDEIVDVDAELAGVDRVERMLGVDEGGDSAGLLRLGDRVQAQG